MIDDAKLERIRSLLADVSRAIEHRPMACRPRCEAEGTVHILEKGFSLVVLEQVRFDLRKRVAREIDCDIHDRFGDVPFVAYYPSSAASHPDEPTEPMEELEHARLYVRKPFPLVGDFNAQLDSVTVKVVVSPFVGGPGV